MTLLCDLADIGLIFVIWISSIFEFFRSLISPRMKEVANQVVVITGAGSSLGQLMCVRFAELDSIVVGWGTDADELDATKAMVREKTGQVMMTYICNTGDPEAVYSTMQRTREGVNAPISIFVNNVGVVLGKLLLNMPDDQIKEVFRVNAFSHFWTTKAVLPEMMERRRGQLVFIASVGGLFGGRRLTEYCASEAAAIVFAESLTAELMFGGYPEITVTCVCPWLLKNRLPVNCQSKWSYFLPPLDLEKATELIVAAILQDQTMVAIPRVIYFINFLKSILPMAALMQLYKALGAGEMMDQLMLGDNKDK